MATKTGKSLIIVESPAKTKTLKNFLGDKFMVEASYGHVRDLPRNTIGVDIANNFTPDYVPIPERKEVLKKLGDAVKKASTVYLASDPDREGEAIAWHLANALKIESPLRIQYNSLTKSAVEAALQNPTLIDQDRVDAQETRRILDRLIGYRLSPILGDKVQRGLSAGRVQSVAVRLVVDREREIQAFVPVEYWSLTASLTPKPPEERFPFDARFVGRGKEKLELKTEADTNEVLAGIEGGSFVVATVKAQEKKRNASPPFITSTLQQEASRKLGFGNRRTMSIAQQLYEGVELGEQGSVGLITYMRTDSTRIEPEAQAEAARFIGERFGALYVPAKPPIYKTKGAAQDAHEAIRPTSAFRSPELVAGFLTPEQMKLYRLIWQRFVASQMMPAVFDVTTADIDNSGYTFRATGSVVKFNGFMAVYTEGKDTDEKSDEEKDPLPALKAGQALDLIKLDPKQHFTEPPPRFSEATLVKALEEKGIGRPSTYASITATIQDREYVTLEEKRFRPTELGFVVNDLLVKHFPTVLDVQFTAGMETKLDEIADGSVDKIDLLNEFYGPFQESVVAAKANMERVKPAAVETEFKCPVCEKPMLLRQSKYGPFLGCSGYPKCKTTQKLAADGTPAPPEEKAQPVFSDTMCPKCGKPMVEREGPRGKFLGCSGYPKCKTIVQIPGEEGKAPVRTEQTLEIACPKCKKPLVSKSTRFGAVTTCTDSDNCDFKTWNKLNGCDCPTCGWPVGEASFRGKPTGKIKCTNPDCDYAEKVAV